MAAWLSGRDRQGWSWAELSRRSGLPVWKLRWWQRRLKRAGDTGARGTAGGATGAFVAVEIAPASVSASPLEIVTRAGHRVSVPPGFDREHLVRLLEALASAC